MAKATAFNSVVAARTRAAQKLSSTSSLLTKFEALGGLKADLLKIAQHGSEAESLNHAQGVAGANGKIATQATRDAFLTLKKDYAAVMAVVTALKPQFSAQRDVLTRIDSILKNEAETGFSTEEIAGADGKPATKRTARRVASQEAVRAEIARDASALLAFNEVASALNARKVTKARLTKLQTDAAALSGALSSGALSAGEKKVATAQEGAAVNAQHALWVASSRLLYALSKEEPTVAELLVGTVFR
jgi:hypothetical protein